MIRTYTFLHTDIEASSAQWESDPVAMRQRVDQLFAIIQEAAQTGRVYKSLGDGLACVFESPTDAIFAAVAMQLAIEGADLTSRIRVGIHTGEAEEISGDFMGSALNRVARITALGHGGQILASEITWKGAQLGPGKAIQAADLGEHQTKGHLTTDRIFQILAPGLRNDFPPLRGESPPNNIPTPAGIFIGRVHELGQLDNMILAQRRRLTSILGFGGIGKSTLAIHAGQMLLSKFQDRVWWVACEQLYTASQISSEIRGALDINDPTFDACSDFADLTRGKPALLILDCFERLAPEAVFVEAILAGCPGLQILVTSRVALDTPSENRFLLGGLIDSSRKKPDVRYAVELFAETARRVNPSWKPKAKDRATINQIVLALEGIPLAILLTASRIGHLTLQEIQTHLSTSLLRTASTVSGVEGRHANLRRVIDSSFDLLEPFHQEALSQMAVFRGGFTLEAATAVITTPDLDFALGHLLNCSLLTADARQGSKRFRILDSVSEYLHELWTLETETGVSDRHAAYYTFSAQELQPMVAQENWIASSKWIGVERANLGAATHWAAKTDRHDLILELQKCCLEPLLEAGAMFEFGLMAEASIKAAADMNEPAILAKVLGLVAAQARREERWGDLENALVRRAAIARESGDIKLERESLLELLSAVLEFDGLDRIPAILDQLRVLPSPEFSAEKLMENALTAVALVRIGAVTEAQNLTEELDSGEHLWALSAREAIFVRLWLGRAYFELGWTLKSAKSFQELIRVAVEQDNPHAASLGLYWLTKVTDELRLKPILRAIKSIPRARAPKVASLIRKLSKELSTDGKKALGQQNAEPDWRATASEFS